MREILFRGKDFDSDWVCGDLIQEDDLPYIRENVYTAYKGLFNSYAVQPDTIGQYTGLRDKSGTRIFEGDIVHFHDLIPSFFDEQREFTGTVEYGDNSFIIVCDTSTHYRWMDYEIEVIGNIYDNPELLKTEVQE